MAAWFASTWSSVSSVSSDLAATAVEVMKSTIVPVIADSLATITRKRGREEEPAVCVPAKTVVAASSPSPALANNEVIVGSSNSKRGRLAIADEDGNADQMAAYAALVGVAAKLPAATRLASFDSLTAQFRGTGARSLEAASDLSRRIGVYAKPALAFDVGRWPADTTRKRWDWKHRSKGVQLVHSSVTSLPVDTVQHQPPSEAPSHEPPALNASQPRVLVAATAAPQRQAPSALLAYADATAAATSPVKLTTAPAITAPAGLTPALASLHVLRQRAASTTHVGGAGAAAVPVAPPPQLRRQAPPEAAPAAVTSPRAPPGSGSPVPVMSSTMSAFGWAADSLVGGLWSQSEDNGAAAPSPSLGTSAAVAVASPSSHGVLPPLGASTASTSSHGVLPPLGASTASTGVAGDFALLGGNLGARVKAAVTLLQSVKIRGGAGAASTGAFDDRNSDLLTMIDNLIHGRPPGEGRGKENRPAAPVAAAVPGSAARSIASSKSPLPPARLAFAATAAAGAPPAPPSQPPQPAKEQEQEEVLDDDEVVVDDGDGVIDLMGDEDEDEQDGDAADADDDGVIDLVSDDEGDGDGTEEDNADDGGEEEEDEEEEDAVMEDEEGADDAGDDDWQWLVTPADKSGSITEDDYRMLSRFLRPDPDSRADLMARHASGLAVVGACDTDTVTLGNLQCLNDGEWVNDEAVNFEVKRLNHIARAYAAAVAQEVMTSSQADAGAGEGAGATAAASSSSSSSSSAAPSSSSAPPAAADGPAVDSRGATRRSPRIWVTTSHFLARLAETSAGYDYPGVARWSKKAKVDIADLDLILVPINWGNTHWALAVIDLLHQAIHYYDSMSPVNGTDAAVYDVGSHPDERDAGSTANGEDDDEDPAGGGRWAAKCRHLARWVRDEWKAKHGEAVDTAPWPILIHPRATVPQQRNTFDCGMFAVHLARCIVTGQRFSFSQADIPVLRRRLALDIIKSGPTGNGVMATGFEFLSDYIALTARLA